MSSTRDICTYINPISNYTIEEFNTYLEESTFTSSYFKNLEPSRIETIKDTFIDYNIDIRLLVYNKCKIALNPTIELVQKHLEVSKPFY